MPELEPCPFCGNGAELLYYPEDGFLPKCVECDGMIEKSFTNKNDAIKAWNTRAGGPVKIVGTVFS